MNLLKPALKRRTELMTPELEFSVEVTVPNVTPQSDFDITAQRDGYRPHSQLLTDTGSYIHLFMIVYYTFMLIRNAFSMHLFPTENVKPV